MQSKHDLNQALRDLKQADDAALMSRDDITALLAAHPAAASNTAASDTASSLSRVTTGHLYRNPWVVGGSLALAATVAFVAVNTWDADPTIVGDTRTQTVQNQGTPVMSPPLADDAARASEAHGNVSAAESSKPDSVHPAILVTPTIQIAAEQLTRFGLQYERGRITYIEDDHRVTIRANGIATKSTTVRSDEAVLAPVMVVVYHDEQYYAAWTDRKDDGPDVMANSKRQMPQSNITSINGLIAIRVSLTPTDILASKADVVLWFAGTREVAERLPSPYRQQLLSELGMNESPTPTKYTLPDDITSPFVTSSTLFPNPLQSGVASIRLRMKKSAVSSCIVTDMFGKQIAVVWDSRQLSQGSNEMPLLGLDDAPTGVYNVVITFDGGNDRMIQRLMIQR